jgi:hypothetical protein
MSAPVGPYHVRVSRTFLLEEAGRAHQLGESGQAGGKMVLTGADH